MLGQCHLKLVTSEKIGGSGVISTLGTWYGGVVMGVLWGFKHACNSVVITAWSGAEIPAQGQL
jgi:hypothetical protein